jgi:superfamily II DNA or RNA helicase/diadenosine tetraphosphate (Ap4A) HIT family hydrolase
MTTDLSGAIAAWGALWGLPGLEGQVQVEFSPRLRVSLGRARPDSGRITLHEGLRGSRTGFLLEVLCHEVAHVAVVLLARELDRPPPAPHGPEWEALVMAAGFRPVRQITRAEALAEGVVLEPLPEGDPDPHCPFCLLPDSACEATSELARAFLDRFPVSPGHTLITTRRHVADWFSATEEERAELLELVERVKGALERTARPDGYNLGVNVGEAGGQTVPHVHLHLIPRYRGDMPDPRGGVRHVIPEKGNYLAVREGGGEAMLHPRSSVEGLLPPHLHPLVRGGEADPLLPHLVAHLAGAHRVDVAVAFILRSGVQLVEEHLRDLMARGGRARILTGDSMGITEPEALLRLLDLGPGLELRVFESRGRTSFHPKSYLCVDGEGRGTAFVGSSNLSRTALKEGVEWNYRVIPSRDTGAFAHVEAAFEALFQDPDTVPCTPEWIEGYRARRHRETLPEVVAGVAEELPLPPPEPHSVQQEALAALADARAKGLEGGLVVLATGLGKTWLAAFDTVAAQAKRVLFVAHREEILDQALRTFRRIRPDAALGKYTGSEKVLDAEVTFASIQTLARGEHRSRFAPDHFDYIVVDEFHHASAPSYRRVLDTFTPRFLLGLTATPERTDGGDLLALCGGHLAYRCDLAEGIRRGLLAPFDYFGVPDAVDYANIPWRNGRFDETELTNRLAVHARAQNALEQLRLRGGTRVLAFCVSQRHAEFMRAAFAREGLRVAAVHSGATSDPRAVSLERLAAGELDVLFAVDLFNEGVDLPEVDTILMLRPTESAILWLQQFGRGLRWKEGKRLRVVDYIGNHRSFLLKPRLLLQLGEGSGELAHALRLVEEGRVGGLLPPGCSVTYDLEVREILGGLLAQEMSGGDTLRNYYRAFRERVGVRPRAAEAHRDGFSPSAARKGYGSWFGLVRAEADLLPGIEAVEATLRPFLQALETTPMTRSYKMVVLLAMLAEGAFPGPLSLEALVARVQRIVRRRAPLRSEFEGVLDDPKALRSHLLKHPIRAWTEGGREGEVPWFVRTDEGLAFRYPEWVQGNPEGAASLVEELAEWRLEGYLNRAHPLEGAPRIPCAVARTEVGPVLELPSRSSAAGIPEGWVEVVVDGEPLHANFSRTTVDAMHRIGETDDLLPTILERWFGDAGSDASGLAGGDGGLPPGARVLFERAGEGYRARPEAEAEAEKGPRLWERYVRAEVPGLFGFEFRGMEAQTGVVERPGLVLLFVTLEKTGQPQAHQYEDQFLTADRFQWQSQNRTTRASAAGQRLARHREENREVHLFVRGAAKVRGRTQPFAYAGPLEFERWEGDKPITVWWRLRNPVPNEARSLVQLPSER